MPTIILFELVVFAVALFLLWKLSDWIDRLFARLRGLSGEKFVSKKLHKLDPAHYKILNDIMLPSKGNTHATQIDHIVVSNYGIFCIETKALEGWIFGNANQERWTQVIFRHHNTFYNPLRQNFAHRKAIEDLLGSQRLKKSIISLIAFPDADKLKISGTDSVGCARDVVRKIERYIEPVYSDAERDETYDLLVRANIIDKEARKLHIREVREFNKVIDWRRKNSGISQGDE